MKQDWQNVNNVEAGWQVGTWGFSWYYLLYFHLFENFQSKMVFCLFFKSTCYGRKGNFCHHMPFGCFQTGSNNITSWVNWLKDLACLSAFLGDLQHLRRETGHPPKATAEESREAKREKSYDFRQRVYQSLVFLHPCIKLNEVLYYLWA